MTQFALPAALGVTAGNTDDLVTCLCSPRIKLDSCALFFFNLIGPANVIICSHTMSCILMWNLNALFRLMQ